MEGSIIIGVDCRGQWVEKSNRYVWHWKEGEMLEMIAMIVQSDVLYDDFVNLIISFCGLNCQPEEFAFSYMRNFFENQRVLSFKITNQVRLRVYLSDLTRPVLRVYIVEKTRENENQNVEEEDIKKDFIDDRLDDLDMNIPDGDQTPTPIDATNTMCSSSQSTQSGNLQDDGTEFFIGMSFKDKNELSNTLFISCLKKGFRIKKVIYLSSVFCFKCANSNCKWWLRAVKYSDRFVIHKHEKHHTCGSEHISGQNPHATAKVLGEYFRSSFPDGKGPSTRLMDLVRGTLEHGYKVLDAYRYMIESINPGSKTTLHLDENERLKYFFVSYGAWIQGFRHLRKGIAVDGTFLKSRYNGVLLAAVAQNAENHIFPIAFYMGSLFFTSAYFDFCIRHLGENIRNNYHNKRVVTFFYRAAKTYSREEFLDHFNQIADVNPKATEFLARVSFERWSREFCSAIGTIL
ncbi:hypothetical protein P3S68_019756 [Capsicum galapagoense]